MRNIRKVRASVANLFDAAIAYVDAENALDGTFPGQELNDLRLHFVDAEEALHRACHNLAKHVDATCQEHFDCLKRLGLGPDES